MKEESKKSIKILILQYLKKKDMHMKKESYSSLYSFKNGSGKTEQNEDLVTHFIEDFSLLMNKDSNQYKLWLYIHEKDAELAREMVLHGIDYPKSEYAKGSYIEGLTSMYIDIYKENELLFSAINMPAFLNKGIYYVKDLFEKDVLKDEQKKIIINYYLDYKKRNSKFDTLETRRILTILCEGVVDHTQLNLIKEKRLDIKVKNTVCVRFDVSIQQLMEYSLKLSHSNAIDLLKSFSRLLPQISNAETQEIIESKEMDGKYQKSHTYAIMTNLDEKVIKNIFTTYVNSYVDNVKEDVQIISDELLLECLRFATIKAIKESLSEKLSVKDNKISVKKI